MKHEPKNVEFSAAGGQAPSLPAAGSAVVAAGSPGPWHSAPSAPDLAAGRHPWTVREQRT